MTGAIAVVAHSGPSSLINVSPSVATGIGGASTVQTNIVTASSSVGDATFMWTYEAGDASISATAPMSASTRWTAFGLEPSEVRESIWKVTASSGGSPFASTTIPVSIQRL